LEPPNFKLNQSIKNVVTNPHLITIVESTYFYFDQSSQKEHLFIERIAFG
jgi:hypothetical protein